MVDFQSRDTSRGIDDEDGDDEDDGDEEPKRADAERPGSEKEPESSESPSSEDGTESRGSVEESESGGSTVGDDARDQPIEDPVEKARAATQDRHDAGASTDPLAGDADTEQSVAGTGETDAESSPSSTDPLAGDAASQDSEPPTQDTGPATEDGREHASHEQTGHEHAGHEQTGHEHASHDTGHEQTGSEHSGHDHAGHEHAGHDHASHGHSHGATATQVGVAVVTISSTRTREDDPSGDVIQTRLASDGHDIVTRDVIRDDLDGIQNVVAALTDRSDVDAVVTTGGTGVTPDDVTVEAVEPLFDKELPGFGELFRILSYEDVGTMALASRATAGIVDGSVVFCLPGSEAAVRLGVEELIAEEVGHLVGLAQREG